MSDTPPRHFPEGFYWGASVSAYQVEGGNHNSWSEWELVNAERLARESAELVAPTLPDWPRIEQQATDPQNYVSGRAADHYHRYKEDLKLAADHGLTSFRFSLEWSRIEPKLGVFDQAALDHYRDIILTCRQLGLEPFVTIWHWTLPTWVSEIGGWAEPATVNYFKAYVAAVVQSLGDQVTFWVTLNEPEVYTDMSYRLGSWPPQHHSFRESVRVLKNLAKGHRAADRIIKRHNSLAQVGISKHNISLAVDRNIVNAVLKKWLDRTWNFYFLRLISGYQDFIGLNYYFHSRTYFSKALTKPPLYSDMGWELYPEGLLQVLKGLRRYHLPIYITENGLADAADHYRSNYIISILGVVHEAIQLGIPVKGYSHWSLLDNFEWDKGFWPRFGLIEVDYKTMKRKPRASFGVYGAIAKRNWL